jgi:hypothetical protein
VPSHRAQLRLADRAKIIDIANEPLALREVTTERLIDEVLQRVKEFTAFTPYQRRIRAVDIKNTAVCLFTSLRAEVKSGRAEDVV